MAKVYNSTDAAGIKPKFVPDHELLARDDSGGPDWEPRTAQFGDGGDVMGAKAHLSASGGTDDSEKNGEQTSEPREAAAKRASSKSQ